MLQGSYPVSQVREPMSIIQFLAERVDLVSLLSINHPESHNAKWSAFDICEAWAIKRGYNTARLVNLDSSQHLSIAMADENISCCFESLLFGARCNVLQLYGSLVEA